MSEQMIETPGAKREALEEIRDQIAHLIALSGGAHELAMLELILNEAKARAESVLQTSAR